MQRHDSNPLLQVFIVLVSVRSLRLLADPLDDSSLHHAGYYYTIENSR
jgi:hypothetical protein